MNLYLNEALVHFFHMGYRVSGIAKPKIRTQMLFFVPGWKTQHLVPAISRMPSSQLSPWILPFFVYQKTRDFNFVLLFSLQILGFFEISSSSSKAQSISILTNPKFPYPPLPARSTLLKSPIRASIPPRSVLICCRDMEDYAEELRTPPVSLVSLVGLPDLHPTISSYLHSEQPPINTLALPDFSKISIFARKNKESRDPSRPMGILKREWLAKHRTKIPAIVAVMFGSDQVSGDPAQWLQVCTDLDNLKYDFLPQFLSFSLFVFVWIFVNVDLNW